MPLGLFFLVRRRAESYANCKNLPEMSLHTLFYGFDGTNHEFYCYWPMPYWHSARIELANETGEDLKSVSCIIEYKPADVLAYPAGPSRVFLRQAHAQRVIRVMDYITPHSRKAVVAKSSDFLFIRLNTPWMAMNSPT